MNLTSCDECGVVFDRNKLRFADEDDYDRDDPYPSDKYVWINRDYKAYVTCPVCKEGKILEDDK